MKLNLNIMIVMDEKGEIDVNYTWRHLDNDNESLLSFHNKKLFSLIKLAMKDLKGSDIKLSSDDLVVNDSSISTHGYGSCIINGVKYHFTWKSIGTTSLEEQDI